MTSEFRSHVRTFGHGVHQALAIHCTLAHSGAWSELGRALEDKVTLTAFDLPSHGKSADWDGQGDLHRLCTDVALSHLKQPKHVIGHSFGATVALRLAVERLDLVRSLTMIEPVFFAAAIVKTPERMKAHDIEAAPYFEALESGDPARAARLFNRFWGDGTKWESMPVTTRQYMADRMNFVLGQSAMIIDDNAGIIAQGRLEKTDVPCLLIEGDQSADIIDAINASLANLLPNVRRAIIAGAGHMSPITHPKIVAKEILDLIEMAEK